MNLKKLAAIIPLATMLLSTPLYAAGGDAEIQDLRAQLAALSRRLDELEKSNVDLQRPDSEPGVRAKQSLAATDHYGKNSATVDAAESITAPAWTQRIMLKGDFRQRYENIEEEGEGSRSRSRIRARAAIIAVVNNEVEVGLGLASGGNDPVSTNQTLGGGGSTKNINLDLAYFKWSGLENTTIVGGKFKNILYKPGKQGMLWDGDWTPEGLGLAWTGGDFFVNAVGTWLESDSKKDVEFAYAVQAGLRKNIGDRVNLTAGIGYYSIDTAGKGSFFGDDDDFFGNSFDPVSNRYAYSYEEIELFADIGFELAGRPASVFVDYVQNQDVAEFNTGYAIGFKYGSARAKGGWQFGYIYSDLEADAAFGLLVDSSFGGGGTDAHGHILKGSFAIAQNWNANITYFLNQKDADAGNEHDYDRLQLDLAFKY